MAKLIQYANNAYSTLSGAITNVATTITVQTGEGARFPSLSGSQYFYATLIDNSNNIEIVKVTARSTDTLTVTRGQDGTSGRAYSSGDRIELRVTAGGITDIINTYPDNIVGALTNKTTPVDADVLHIEDSAASGASKYATFTQAWTNYFKGKADALYQALDATLTSIASVAGVAGDILYASGTDTWARLAKGTDGQVLTLASGLPSWATASSGGMTLLGTLTTTSGTTQSLTSIAAGYFQFYIEVDGVSFASGSNTLTLALSSTNGAAYGTAQNVAPSIGTAASTYKGPIVVYGVSATSQYSVAMSYVTNGAPPASPPTQTLVAVATNTAAVVNAIRFAGGTFDAGTIRIYGVK